MHGSASAYSASVVKHFWRIILWWDQPLAAFTWPCARWSPPRSGNSLQGRKILGHRGHQEECNFWIKCSQYLCLVL